MKNTENQSIGFRDCILEVSRYLVNIEGFDFNHPLRMRLLTHLQNFVDTKLLTPNSIHQHNHNLDFISPSSSCPSSPIKFETNNFSPLISNSIKNIQYPTQQQTPQIVNNSAFVQINITANNNNNENVDDFLTDNKRWSTSCNNINDDIVTNSHAHDNYYHLNPYWNQAQVQLSNNKILSN